MRILFLAPQPFFEVRGTPLAVRAMVETLAGLGHHVDLLTYPQGAPFAHPGVTHLRSARLPVGRVKPGPSFAKLALDVPFIARAAWRVLRGRYDAVHAVEEAAHLIAPVARLARVPLVMDVDSAIPDQLRESGFARRGPLLWCAERLERYALGRAAIVVTVCDSLTRGVYSRAPAARVFQIEDPPLVAGAAPVASVATLRTSLGLDERPVALYSGNFEAYQGVELLVDAAALLPDVQIVFMGGEAEHVRTMQARVPSAGARCVFTGKRPPEELAAFLTLAGVVVSPRCRGVNTPFKLYTYLASGRPLVATRIATHTQLLDDTLAMLVDPTPEGIAAGIRVVLARPAAAAERAARGRALIEREYSRARYAEKVARAYAALGRV